LRVGPPEPAGNITVTGFQVKIITTPAVFAGAFVIAAPVCFVRSFVFGETDVAVNTVQAFFARRSFNNIVFIELPQ
jgi:hypothetical protein